MNILVLTDPMIGGNFLTWSLYYLTGQTRYQDLTTKQYRNLPDNPLDGINTHKFDLGHQTELASATKLATALDDQSNNPVNCIYVHWNFRNATKEQSYEFLTKFRDWADKIVLVTIKPPHYLYHCKYQSRVLIEKYADPKTVNTTWEEQHQDFVEHFFKESNEAWKSLGLTEVWDYREFLALNFRPFFIEQADLDFLEHKDYYQLDSLELWTQFDFCLADLFAYLKVDIDPERLATWKSFYNQWRGFHQDRMRFMLYFDQIIENILVGRSMDLTRFNLDIVREATIQHVLIYQYGLNLQTWKLDKFTNTKQLHDLLEPNIHHITPYDIHQTRFPRAVDQ